MKHVVGCSSMAIVLVGMITVPPILMYLFAAYGSGLRQFFTGAADVSDPNVGISLLALALMFVFVIQMVGKGADDYAKGGDK